MKLWVKIALLNCFIVTFLSVLIGLGIRDTVIDSMRGELTNQGISIARNLSDRIADPVLLNDLYSINEAIGDVRHKERDIEYVFVTGEKGEVLGHTFSKGLPSGISRWNPVTDDTPSIQLLDTERGFIRDVGVRVFESMGTELHLGVREERIAQTLGRIRDIIIALTGFVIIFGVILSFAVSRLTTRHLNSLVDFTSALSKGDFGRKLNISSSDEVGQLAARFQDLSAELKAYKERIEESYKQMLRTEKLTALGRLSAGLAHEIRNPLTSIKVLFQTFKDNPSLTKQDMQVVIEAAEQMDQLLTKFLNFSRSDEFAATEVYVNGIIKQILKLIQFQLKRQGIKPVLELERLPPVRGDRALLQQALMNLILNAVEAMPEGGTLTVTTKRDADYLSLTVGDTGRGIADSIRDKVFDPFFTTKEEGTGLGLSIVYNVVMLHHGQISFESGENGTTFSLRLPWNL